MPAGPYAEFSFLTLAVLLGVIALSGTTFWLLVRRATSHRQWVALSDWGRARGIRYHAIPEGGDPPAPFSTITAARPVARLWLRGKKSHFVQMQPREAPIVGTAAPSTTWHVLVREIESNWPPTALRPTKSGDAATTLLDLFSLASYPSMISSERFVIFGADSSAAKTISKSSLPALLPPDVGLLLHGRLLVLDFSSRPFDTIEFDRILGLAKHITSHLPSNKN